MKEFTFKMRLLQWAKSTGCEKEMLHFMINYNAEKLRDMQKELDEEIEEWKEWVDSL